MDLPQPVEFRVPADTFNLYMREVGEVALLTREEETELARRVQAGDGQAREHMIRANLRLVVKIAREYENLGMPLLDLINEGNMGLMLAVDRFDPDKGAKLSTYGALWIRQRIRRALACQGRTIRLPSHVVEKASRLGHAERRLRQRLGRDASEEELADELGIGVDRIGKLRRASFRSVSLDAPIGDEESSRLADVVADDNAELPGMTLDKRISMALLREVLPKLPPREAAILRMRFGLGGDGARTLEEIGSLMNLTRERIRQLQNLALVRLRRMMEERDCIWTTA